MLISGQEKLHGKMAVGCRRWRKVRRKGWKTERGGRSPFQKNIEQKQLISIALSKLHCLDCTHFTSLAGEQRKEMKPVEFLRLIVVQGDLGISVSMMAWGHWGICQGNRNEV